MTSIACPPIDDDSARSAAARAVEDVERNIAAAGFEADSSRGLALRASRPADCRLGAVSYLNTKPLVDGLDARARICSRSASTCPSQCAALLHEGRVDLGLIPAIEYLRGDYRIVPGVAIGSDGPVASVALFRRVPIEQIGRSRSTSARAPRWRSTRILCASAGRSRRS